MLNIHHQTDFMGVSPERSSQFGVSVQRLG